MNTYDLKQAAKNDVWKEAIVRENEEVAQFFSDLLSGKIERHSGDELEMTLTVFASKRRAGGLTDKGLLFVEPSCRKMIQNALAFHRTVPNSMYLSRLEEELGFLDDWITSIQK